MPARKGNNRCRHRIRRPLVTERLEDRHLLAVTFAFNYIGGNAVGFNDPGDGDTFRAAIESAAARLGDAIMQDATIEMDVFSREFTGSSVATATSEVPDDPVGGGFVHAVVPAKIIGLGDLNDAAPDGRVEVFFFDAADPFTYQTDPASGVGNDEIDFQAVIIHELVHMLGFTSATRANGGDDSGNGITTPGTWRPYDEFVSDVDGNRLIDADPLSPTAFRMDTSPTGWPLHSVGGKGPDAGLFFDGPIASAVHGSRVPLYSPATFALQSSVSHLDSEGFPQSSFIFSPLTHLMSHAIVDGEVPQELTLLEKAILADTGIMMFEDELPVVTPPENITIEGNAEGGFSGSNQALADFLTGVSATDLFDPNPAITHNAPNFLSLGDNTITFAATDASGNVGTATAIVTVADTTPPDFDPPATVIVDSNLPTGADLTNTDLVDAILATASDIVDPDLQISASPESFPFGTTSVTFTVTDDSGNAASATTSVTLNDIRMVVTTLDDELDADPGSNLNDLSLREAITLANSQPGLDTIRFADGLSGSVLLDPALGQLEITESLHLSGLGQDLTTIDAQSQSRVIEVTAGDLTINSLTISGGRTAGESEQGAGIRFRSTGSLSVVDSTVSGNHTSGNLSHGGGVYVLDGSATITGSTFSSNSTEQSNSDGGAMALSGASATIINSTISGNTTVAADSEGGGIHATQSPVTLVGSTVSGNVSAAGGGGIFADRGNLDIDITTITGNQASAEGGGIAVPSTSPGLSLTIHNSIVAANTDSGAAPDFMGTDVLTGATPVGFTLIGDNRGTTLAESQLADPVTGNFVGDPAGDGVIDALLGPLADNGGPTLTHLLLDGSPAINTGDPAFDANAFSPPLINDQRGEGFPRISGRQIDMGSIEVMGEIVIDWPNPEDIVFGTELGGEQLNASANIAGTFEYLPPAGTVLSAGQAQVLTANFTPANLVNFSPTSATAFITVVKADPVINWVTPEAIVFGTALTDTQLNAASNVPGTFDYTPPPGTVLDAGENQVLSVTLTPNDGTNFHTATASVLIDVTQATPFVTWENPDDIAFPTPLGPGQLNATANVPGTFLYTPPAGVLLTAVPNQTLTVTFTPESNNFQPITQTVSINVNKGDPVITWNDPNDIVAGTPLSDLQLNATADFRGTITYDPPIGTLLPSGLGQVLTATFTPQDSSNLNEVTATVTINVLSTQDYGDAPSEYPVLLSQDGARHSSSSLTLGSQFDLDVDGQPSELADGDAGDDGVNQLADLVAVSDVDTAASFLVNASQAGKLDAWIDFNGDFDWDDAGEQIFVSVDLSEGDNRLVYTVPAGAVAGNTAARFRLSTVGGLTPRGSAGDGEVEDYLVTIQDGSTAPDAIVRIDGAEPTLSVQSDAILVSGLFRAPLSNLGALRLLGGNADDRVVIDAAGLRAPPGGVQLDGGAGGNSITVLGDGVSLDLTGNVFTAERFRRLDLSSPGAVIVAIDAATVARLSPALRTLSAQLGQDDRLDVKDVGDWRLSNPFITVDSTFTLTANTSLSGGDESIEAVAARPWQNFLRAGDVNNDGTVTAGDALRIINELSRRSFSDTQNQQLVDPLSLAIWPSVYFDHNGDGRATALDALRVINDVARQSLGSGEGLVAASLAPDETSQQVTTRLSTIGPSSARVVVDASAARSTLPTEASGELPGPSADHPPSVAAVDQLLSDQSFIRGLGEFGDAE